MPSEFSLTHRVQFCETDMAGVAHFANYFRWMEEVEHAFFRSLGLNIVMTYEGAQLSWPRVSASCEYQGSLRFEDEVELRLSLTRVGNKSLAYDIRFLKGAQPVALGKITAVCVMVDAGEFRAVSIPPAIREKFRNSGLFAIEA